MADQFTITAYNAATDKATVTFSLDARPSVPAATYSNILMGGVPKDTVDNVKAYFRDYADKYIAGRQQEAARATVSPEVAALLNVPTGF